MKKFLGHGNVRWAAVVLLLLAYVLASQGLVSAEGVVFNGINCLGSLLMIANSLAKEQRDWQVAIFNMVWVAIGIVTMMRVFF